MPTPTSQAGNQPVSRTAVSSCLVASALLLAAALCATTRLPPENSLHRAGAVDPLTAPADIAAATELSNALTSPANGTHPDPNVAPLAPSLTTGAAHQVQANATSSATATHHALRHQLVVGAGDSLVRYLINGLRDPAVDGPYYAKEPLYGDVRQALGVPGRCNTTTTAQCTSPRFLFESHLLHRRARLPFEGAAVGAVRHAAVHAKGRQPVVVVSYGLWSAIWFDDVPRDVARYFRRALVAALSAANSSGVHGMRIVVYVPHCHPAKPSANATGCFAGSRGDAYRRAVACAAGELAATYGAHVRIDVYDLCEWVRHGTTALGATTDYIHFHDELSADIAADFAARFGATAPAAWRAAATSPLAWSTASAGTGAEVAAAVQQRYQCPTNFFAQLAAEEAATSRGLCAQVSHAAERNATLQGWKPMQGCGCRHRGPASDLGDGCTPTDTMRRGSATQRIAILGASLCAIRKPHLKCPQRNLTSLDLAGAVAPGQPAFEEALLTVCAAPDAYGLCLQNLGARIGRTAYWQPGSPELRRVLADVAKTTLADADSVCRCGFRFDSNASNASHEDASPWCAAMRPKVEGARAIFAAAREERSGTARLGCDHSTLSALDVCGFPPIRNAAFHQGAPDSMLAAMVRARMGRARGRHRWL